VHEQELADRRFPTAEWQAVYERSGQGPMYPANPMAKVTRPAAQGSPIRFYELDVVERIVGYQPTAERRALFALLYGTGIEVSVALALTRADVWEARRRRRWTRHRGPCQPKWQPETDRVSRTPVPVPPTATPHTDGTSAAPSAKWPAMPPTPAIQ
jgi:integrase